MSFYRQEILVKIHNFFTIISTNIALLYQRLGRAVHGKYANHILVLLFMLEAVFFIPADPLLLIYCIERQDRSWLYATLATVASIFGGIVSYAIGAVLLHAIGPIVFNAPIIRLIMPYERLVCLSQQFKGPYAWAALLLIGLTPFPYKAITLAAGFCKLSFIPFVVCISIVRGVRFYGIATGVHVTKWLRDHLSLRATILIVLGILCTILALQKLITYLIPFVCT